MTTINVVLGSARTKSNGLGLLNYLKSKQQQLEKENDVELNFINLHDFSLDLFNGPLPPMADKDRNVAGMAKKWLDELQKGDGFLILEPVYNNSLPGAFKNAIDYIAYEIAGKPVRIVSYSTARTGGIMAGYALMPILAELGAILMPTVDVIGQVDKSFTTEGNPNVDGAGYVYFTGVLSNAINEVSELSKKLQ